MWTTVIWTIFAVAALLVLFATFVAAVVVGIRFFERLQSRKSAGKIPPEVDTRQTVRRT